MNSTIAPSPAMMQRFAPSIVPVVAVEVIPDAAAEQLPDNVIKAKRLKPRMRVRAWLTIDGVGQACGGERTVATVSKPDAQGLVEVTFSSPHPTETFKAARRFEIQEG